MKEFGFADIIRLTLSPGLTSSGVSLSSTYKHADDNIICSLIETSIICKEDSQLENSQNYETLIIHKE